MTVFLLGVLLLTAVAIVAVVHFKRLTAAIVKNTVGTFRVRHMRPRPQVELQTDLQGLQRVVFLVHYIGAVLRDASAEDSATLVRYLASCLGEEGSEPPQTAYVYGECLPFLSSEVSGRLYKLKRYGISFDDGGFRGLGSTATGGCACVIRHELMTLPGADAGILRMCLLQITTCMVEQGRAGVNDAVNGSEYLLQKFESHRSQAAKFAGLGEGEMNALLKKMGYRE